MIPLNFGLYWTGAPISYLRYLTFKTLRHFHPHSRIQLFTNKYDKNKKRDYAGFPKQEYMNPNNIKKDYFLKLKDLGVETVVINLTDKYLPFQQADIYRWSFLKHQGGIYLDPDQIILQSFDSLPLKKYEFLYSSYKVNSPYAFNGEFSPIGVLGASLKSKITEYVTGHLMGYMKDKNYNSLGVLMMADVKNKIDMSEAFNAPPQYFYPAPICDYLGDVFSGKIEIKKDNYSCHWFGGSEPGQQFNEKYTEEFARESGQDTISKFLRGKKLL